MGETFKISIKSIGLIDGHANCEAVSGIAICIKQVRGAVRTWLRRRTNINACNVIPTLMACNDAKGASGMG